MNGAALSVQGHPEYTGPEPLITFAIQHDLNVFNQDDSNMIAGEMLQMFANFLRHYKSLASSSR